VLARAAGQGEPLLRIGLDSAHRLKIDSRRPFRVLDPATGKPVWKDEFSGELTVVADGGPEEAVGSVFRIQVGAFSTREAAEAERDRLSRGVGVPGVVRHHPDRGTWRVRLGEAANRDALDSLMNRLRAKNLQGLWIVEEPARPADDVRLRLVDASFNSHVTDLGRLAIVPAKRGSVGVEERTYRGVVEVRISPFGTVRAINWVELETYLLGVVPAELGPEMWPQIEALKAQAVAARTYAWKHRGQFEDEGFDMCATPRCQVYHGKEVEHPLSDRAVHATRGQILTWEGEPISALYTATCGGHTENAFEIFPEEAAPYLSAVPCRAETDALESLKVTLDGAKTTPVSAENAEDVSRDWALLRAVGVLGSADTAERMRRPIDAERLRRWTAATAKQCGRPLPEGPPGEAGDLGAAAATLVRDLGWDERARVLVNDQDVPAVLRDPEAASATEEQRRALATLALADAIRPFPDGRYHVVDPPTGARMLPVLVAVANSCDAFDLSDAVVAGRSSVGIRMFRGKSEIRLPLADAPYLFTRSGGRVVQAPRLELWPGDRVRYRRGADGRIDFLELRPPVQGTSDDRSHSRYSWEVRRTRRQVEAAVNRRVSIGRLEDLRVARRGESGRVVELEVVGSRASTMVRGFDIRRLLKLNENLTVFEIQRDESGRIEAVVFAGRGWGHGVGLCQVGAYGMAIRGSDYRQILAHYYRGARLAPLE
jgi:stage II sporulation protein D